LDDSSRVLYHAAASFAANFTVTVLSAANDICKQAGIDDAVARHAFASLARCAVDRVEREGAAEALTGPITRGDIATIYRHVDALDRVLPATAELYRCLAAATAGLAATSGRISVDQANDVSKALGAETSSWESES
jgi:predicted short-subunit dehydrogenase-like oxidoreductase (DUF2520 family)